MSTQTKLALVVAGLAGVGALIAALTVAYWRHTRPARYLDALDVLGESSRAGGEVDLEPVPAGVAAMSTTASMALGGDGEPAAPSGAGSARGTSGPTPADAAGFRIVDPAPDEPSAPTDRDQSLDADAPESEPVDDPQPVAIVTLEDLFGDSAPDKTEPVPSAPDLEDLWGESSPQEAPADDPGDRAGSDQTSSGAGSPTGES